MYSLSMELLCPWCTGDIGVSFSWSPPILSDVLAFSLDVDACTMPAVCCISAMRSANPSDSSSSWPLPLRDLLPPGLPLLLLKNNFKVLECFTLSYISHRRRFITSLHFTGHREYRKHLNVSFLMFYDRYKARYDSLFLRGIFFLLKRIQLTLICWRTYQHRSSSFRAGFPHRLWSRQFSPEAGEGEWAADTPPASAATPTTPCTEERAEPCPKLKRIFNQNNKIFPFMYN